MPFVPAQKISPPPPSNNLTGTIRFRLTVWYTLLLMAAMIIVLFIVRVTARETMMRDTDARLREDLLEVKSAIEQSYPDMKAIQAELNRKTSAHNTHGMFLHIADAKGKLILSNFHSPLTDLPFIL